MLTIIRRLISTFLFLTIPATAVLAAGPPPGLIHVRGTVISATSASVTVLTSTGTVQISLPPLTKVAGVIATTAAGVRAGAFLGIASTPDMSGKQVAREVVVFPESARGTGEGSYPWDLPARSGGLSKMTNGAVIATKMTNGTLGMSKMTNGTVASTVGRQIVLRYKSGTGVGSQPLVLPPGIPYVTIVPGSPALLAKGVHVFIVAKTNSDRSLSAVRVLAGEHGLRPPM